MTEFTCRRAFIVGDNCVFKYSAFLLSPTGQHIKDLTKSAIFSPRPLWTPPHNLPGRYKKT